MMTNVKAVPVTYWDPAQQRDVTGTNVTYLLDGQPASARLPWIASAPEAQRWIEQQRKRT